MIEIRKIHRTECRQAKELIEAVMSGEFLGNSNSYPTEDLSDIFKFYGNVGDAFFVAVANGSVIGTVAVKKESDRVAILRRFLVAPSHRGQKIGLQLIERVLDFCKEVGYQEVVVKTTAAMKRAIDVCKQVGFQERGHIELGPIQIARYAYFIRENSPLGSQLEG